jgi:hypothetical protein
MVIRRLAEGRPPGRDSPQISLLPSSPRNNMAKAT